MSEQKPHYLPDCVNLWGVLFYGPGVRERLAIGGGGNEGPWLTSRRERAREFRGELIDSGCGTCKVVAVFGILELASTKNRLTHE